MSLIDHARSEMQRANFPEDDQRVMLEILEKFFGQWDSGGAVWGMAPVLQRLIAGAPLSPLTGADDEWSDVSGYGAGEHLWQNKRYSLAFKNDHRAYDAGRPGQPTITFPYYPPAAGVPPPDMVVLG